MKNKTIHRLILILILPIIFITSVSTGYAYWFYRGEQTSEVMNLKIEVIQQEVSSYTIKFSKITKSQWQYYHCHNFITNNYEWKACDSVGKGTLDISTNTGYQFTLQNGTYVCSNEFVYNYKTNYTYYSLSFDGVSTIHVKAICNPVGRSTVYNYFDLDASTSNFTAVAKN